jgi:5-methylcytosine-specific restriction endonuclease McrA
MGKERWQMKKCAKCGEVKPLAEFSKNKAKPDGLNLWCKGCYREYARKWYVDNKDKCNENVRRYRAANPGKMREISRIWDLLNPRKLYERSRRYILSHPDKAREFKRNRRARKNGVSGKFTEQEWSALKEFYDYTCLCCGRKEPEIKLSRDHVIPLKLGGSNSVENIQCLCGSCNSRKKAKHIDYRKEVYYVS